MRNCSKSGCTRVGTVIMDSGCGEYVFCDEHASEATLEHDYTFVQHIVEDLGACYERNINRVITG